MRGRRAARVPQASGLARVDGAAAVLVHVLHPRPEASDLVVPARGHVGRADVREALEVEGAVPVLEGVLLGVRVRVRV